MSDGSRTGRLLAALLETEETDLSALEAELHAALTAALADTRAARERLRGLVEGAAALGEDELLAALTRRAGSLAAREQELAAALARGAAPPTATHAPAVEPAAAPVGPPIEAPAEPQKAPQAAAKPPPVRAARAPTQAPPAPAPRKPTPTAWDARELEVMQEELTHIREFLDTHQGGDRLDLCRFKEMGCLARGAADERQRHPGDQWAWKGLKAEFQDLQKAHWRNDFVIFLSPQVQVTPPEWREMAGLYAELRNAEEALAWVETTSDLLGDAWTQHDAKPVLEGIAAVSSRLHRFLQEKMPHMRDDQQLNVFWRLREIAETRRVFLEALSNEKKIADSALERLAGDLPRALAELQAASKSRRKEEALDELQRVLDDPTFGTAEGDDDRLGEVIAGCLAAGVPATYAPLRDTILEHGWEWMLEDDPRLKRVLKAVTDERDRRAKAAAAATEEEPPDAGLDDELLALLEEVWPHTRSRVGVIVGGVNRDDNRRAIEEAFEFKELRWPSTEPSDPFEKSLAEIRKADVVFLTRFNRRASREAYRACREQDKPLIMLPKGYGLREVIYRAHESLARRHPEA